MPKRSNDFQRLVFLVKKILGDGVSVIESRMLADRRTGKEREVDICIEGIIGGQSVTVCIECCDHGRPADVTWVERMKGRHDHLATNALVLASRTGYSEEALAVAKAEGIQILSYQDLTENEVHNLFGIKSTLWALTYELTPTQIIAGVAAFGSTPAHESVVGALNLTFNAQGDTRMTMAELVHIVLHQEKVADDIGKDGNETAKSFALACELPTEGEYELFLKPSASPDMLARLERLTIFGTCRISPRSMFEMRGANIGATRVVWGKTELDGKDAMFVVAESPGVPPKAHLDLRAKVEVR